MTTAAPIASRKAQLWGFLAFSHGWTWLFWTVASLSGATIWRPPGLLFFVIGGMGVPLGGIVMNQLMYGTLGLRDLARRIVDPTRIAGRWWGVVLLLFPALTILGGTIARVIGAREPPLDLAGAVARATHPVSLAGLMAFTLIIGPLPEEVGWRGYLLDQVQARWNALSAILIVGLLMWVWHLLLFHLPGYSDAFHAIPPTPLHLLFVILLAAVLYTWVYNNTGRSVLAFILFHFTGNFSGEFLGISAEAQTYRLVLTAIVVALVVWRWGPSALRRDRQSATVCRPTMDERVVSCAEAVRSHLDELVRDAKIPGIQYLVVAPEQIVFEYAAGWADIAGRRRLNAATTMMAYSMSKTITAAAVLQLVEAQKVKLDDPIDAYLESQPYGPDVTVRQLMSHTSGIPNPIPLRWVHPAARHDTFDERVELASVLLEHPKLSFPPGTKYRYSNIGYWLLGCIVERAGGEPFPSYVREHVLQPLGITPQELGYVVPDYRDHAKGYLEKYSLMNLVKRFVIAGELIGGYEGRWLRLNDHYVSGAAFGGLVGNARGFGKFLQDQLRPHSALFIDATRRLFYTPQRTKKGKSIPMTLGWHIGTVDDVRFFYKEGGGGGFHSMMRAYPSSGIATVVMTNATGFDVCELLDAMDPRFLSATERRS